MDVCQVLFNRFIKSIKLNAPNNIPIDYDYKDIVTLTDGVVIWRKV